MRSASLIIIVRLRPFCTPPSWVASEGLSLERELIESSNEGSSAFHETLSLLPEEGSKMGCPFKIDSQLCGLVEEEVTVMGKEPQRSASGPGVDRIFHCDLSSGLRVFCDLLIMTSIGTGYDLSASTYSPDGRIFQVSSSLSARSFLSI